MALADTAAAPTENCVNLQELTTHSGGLTYRVDVEPESNKEKILILLKRTIILTALNFKKVASFRLCRLTMTQFIWKSTPEGRRKTPTCGHFTIDST